MAGEYSVSDEVIYEELPVENQSSEPPQGEDDEPETPEKGYHALQDEILIYLINTAALLDTGFQRQLKDAWNKLAKGRALRFTISSMERMFDTLVEKGDTRVSGDILDKLKQLIAARTSVHDMYAAVTARMRHGNTTVPAHMVQSNYGHAKIIAVFENMLDDLKWKDHKVKRKFQRERRRESCNSNDPAGNDRPEIEDEDKDGDQPGGQEEAQPVTQDNPVTLGPSPKTQPVPKPNTPPVYRRGSECKANDTPAITQQDAEEYILNTFMEMSVITEKTLAHWRTYAEITDKFQLRVTYKQYPHMDSQELGILTMATFDMFQQLDDDICKACQAGHGSGRTNLNPGYEACMAQIIADGHLSASEDEVRLNKFIEVPASRDPNRTGTTGSGRKLSLIKSEAFGILSYVSLLKTANDFLLRCNDTRATGSVGILTTIPPDPERFSTHKKDWLGDVIAEEWEKQSLTDLLYDIYYVAKGKEWGWVPPVTPGESDLLLLLEDCMRGAATIGSLGIIWIVFAFQIVQGVGEMIYYANASFAARHEMYEETARTKSQPCAYFEYKEDERVAAAIRELDRRGVTVLERGDTTDPNIIEDYRNYPGHDIVTLSMIRARAMLLLCEFGMQRAREDFIIEAAISIYRLVRVAYGRIPGAPNWTIARSKQSPESHYWSTYSGPLRLMGEWVPGNLFTRVNAMPTRAQYDDALKHKKTCSPEQMARPILQRFTSEADRKDRTVVQWLDEFAYASVGYSWSCEIKEEKKIAERNTLRTYFRTEIKPDRNERRLQQVDELGVIGRWLAVRNGFAYGSDLGKFLSFDFLGLYRLSKNMLQGLRKTVKIHHKKMRTRDCMWGDDNSTTSSLARIPTLFADYIYKCGENGFRKKGLTGKKAAREQAEEKVAKMCLRAVKQMLADEKVYYQNQVKAPQLDIPADMDHRNLKVTRVPGMAPKALVSGKWKLEQIAAPKERQLAAEEVIYEDLEALGAELARCGWPEEDAYETHLKPRKHELEYLIERQRRAQEERETSAHTREITPDMLVRLAEGGDVSPPMRKKLIKLGMMQNSISMNQFKAQLQAQARKFELEWVNSQFRKKKLKQPEEREESEESDIYEA
ncbi:hypothetical protein B0H63DRAFT_523495 [Podospora didyma]|uniref:DUF6604 domain-containing protein n=1 Tax=Podospora didyma TaxID=330526 RepID=A0AAE0NRI3_9PEZI|nr:hypothetical protein B0H63DRAFT_523495 [Podospora didyma]